MCLEEISSDTCNSSLYIWDFLGGGQGEQREGE